MPSDDRGGDFVQLIDLLKGLPYKSLNGQQVILFADIVEVCRMRGQDDFRYIEEKLRTLEKQGNIIVCYADDSCDMIAGVRVVE